MVQGTLAQMENKTALDTSVCIEVIKGNSFLLQALRFEGEQLPFISSVTVFELGLRKTNLAEVDSFILDTAVLDFDEKAAKIASEIEKDLSRRGELIDRPDIFIAATAMANDCELATLNTKDFSKIKGLRILKLR